MSIQAKLSAESSQVFFLGPRADNRQMRKQILIAQELHRLQKQIGAFVGNESSDENELAIARGVRIQTKGPLVVRIANHERVTADVVGDRFADCDVGHPGKKRALDPVVPGDFTARIPEPGLMDNQRRLSQKQGWNETAQTDVVLKKQIAPAEQAEQSRRRWPARDAIVWIRRRGSRRLSDEMNLVARGREFFREEFGDRFDSADTRLKEIGGKKDFQPRSSSAVIVDLIKKNVC